MNKKQSPAKSLTLAALFLAMAMVAQLFGRFNPDFSRIFVGPIINALILLTIYFAGSSFGFLVALATPILAFLLGQLNPAMAPMIPFIMLANFIYALAFAFFHDNLPERITASLFGSVAKYITFILSIRFLLPALGISFPPKLAKNLPVAFGLTQLIAALLGALLAVILIEILRKRTAASV